MTAQCESCSPCGDCNPDQILLPQDMVDDGIKPCDVCDPCIRPERCSFCGNHFCYCDLVIDTEDGLMHKSCAELI